MTSTPSPQPTNKQIRDFALLVGTVLILIGGWQWYRDIYETGRLVLWSIGGVLIVSGFLAPVLLKPIYRVWMKIGHTLGYINTRIIIGLIFYVVVTPIGFIMRILRVDQLREKFDKKSTSYWNDIERPQSVKEHCERQF